MLGKSEEWSRQEIRTVIHFLNCGDFSNEEICNRIWEVCGRDSISREEVHHICAGGKHDEVPPALVNKKNKEKDLNKTEGVSYAAATLPSVGGSSCDVNKQVQTAPAGLYSSPPSGPMTGAGPQHHQPRIRGPVQTLQSTSMVPARVQQRKPHIRMVPIRRQRLNFTAPHQLSMPSSQAPMYHLPPNNWNSYNQTTFFGQMPSTCPQIPAPIQVQAGPKKTATFKGLPIIDPVTGRDVREDITNEPSSQGAKDGSQSDVGNEEFPMIFADKVSQVIAEDNQKVATNDTSELKVKKKNKEKDLNKREERKEIGNMDAFLDKTEKLYKKVRRILKKLTSQKYATLMPQVKQLDITTEESLNGVIDLVFEKAIKKPNFSGPYANVCKHLALDGKKRQLQEDFEEERRKNRRQLGSIRFIGELFKLGMLRESIMHQCIKKLLNQGDEDSLECLCRLLTTIGKELENEKKTDVALMESYFTNMKKIVDKRQTSSRVRFMLQDVIDLQMNNWVPCHDESDLKIIDQIHKETEREAHEQQQMFQQMTFPKRMPDDCYMQKNQPPTSEDGRNMSGKSSKLNYSVDSLKLKVTKRLPDLFGQNKMIS